MRRITVVLLMVFVLAAILGAAAPASAKDGRRERRDRFAEWNYRRPGGPVHRWAYPAPAPVRYGRGDFDRQQWDPYPYGGAYNGGAYNGAYRGPSRPYPYMGYGSSYGYGYGSNYGYGYRHPRSIYVPRSVFVAYPDYVTVVQPVFYDDVVLVPHYRYRVIERYPDRFLLIFGTGALTVILRG